MAHLSRPFLTFSRAAVYQIVVRSHIDIARSSSSRTFHDEENPSRGMWRSFFLTIFLRIFSEFSLFPHPRKVEGARDLSTNQFSCWLSHEESLVSNRRHSATLGSDMARHQDIRKFQMIRSWPKTCFRSRSRHCCIIVDRTLRENSFLNHWISRKGNWRREYHVCQDEMADNEIRLRIELEGCDRMIVERYKALGNKLRQFLQGISRKIHVLVERIERERERERGSRFFSHRATKRNLWRIF